MTAERSHTQAAPGRSQARVEVGEVLRVERLGHLVELTAQLPHLAATVQPGQFAQLRCSSTSIPLLRRPFSVAWTDGDTCSFVFEEVGVGTRLLGALQAGDILDALGPLGHGFSVEVEGPVLCLSGGVGCAPFPLLIRRLCQRGATDVTVLSGAATAQHLYPAERFQRGQATVRVLEATDDGGAGRRGYVTELLGEEMCRDARALFACGPNAMLAAVARLSAPLLARAATAEASVEASMGCGFGTCLGCALPVRGADAEPAWALCCTDGPVMEMRQVDWPAVLRLPGADAA